MPEAVTVFLAPPSFEELSRRLTDRGTESPEQRERRLRTAVEEMAAQDEFDVVVVNDDVQSAVGRLVDLVSGTPASDDGRADPGHAAPCAPSRNLSSGVTE